MPEAAPTIFESAVEQQANGLEEAGQPDVQVETEAAPSLTE